MNSYIFENGLRLIHSQSKNDFTTSSIHVYCDIGSAYETADTHGVSHFIEHMVFKGTNKITNSNKIYTEYDKIGAYFNAYTEKRLTAYTIRCDKTHTERCLYILADILLNSVFDKDEYKKERHVVIEENIRDTNDAEDFLQQRIDEMVYKGSSYSFPVDDVKYHKKGDDLKYTEVLQMYKQFYHPSRMIVSVVTAIPFNTIVRMIRKNDFAKKMKQYPITKQIITNVTTQDKIQYSITNDVDFGAVSIGISFRACSFYSTDKYLLNLLKYILSGSMSGLLFMKLREYNGLTYTCYTDLDYIETAGQLLIYAETEHTKVLKNGNKKGVLPLIIELLNRLLNEGVTEEELVNAKGYVKGKMNMQLENNDIIAANNGIEYLMQGTPENIIPYDKLYDTCYADITREQIQEIIRKYIRRYGMNVCLFGGSLPSRKKIETECEKLGS